MRVGSAVLARERPQVAVALSAGRTWGLGGPLGSKKERGRRGREKDEMWGGIRERKAQGKLMEAYLCLTQKHYVNE